MSNRREGVEVTQGSVAAYGVASGADIPAGTTFANGLLPVPAKAVVSGAVLVRFV